MTDIVANRYVEGLYAPVTEEVTALDLEVTGSLPAELDGRYLRNGPNPVGPVDPAHHHWFTGEGMVHGIRLRDGRAEWYRNRWVRSTAVAEALGERPAPGEGDDQRSVANTNVIGLAGKTLAIVEAGGRPAELTDELDTVCFSDLDGTLRHGFTAHPKRDPRTGELHAASYWWQRPEVIDYTVVGADGRVSHQVDIPVPGNPMVHDCSITETAMVLYDLPVLFDLPLAMEGYALPYGWSDDYGARLGVLPLAGTADQVQWFEIEPCYVFHPINAFDDGDRVVIDVVRHPRMFVTDRNGPNEGPPAIWRYVLDRATGRATETALDDRAVEFPRVDERMVGRHHRFSWATGLGVDAAGEVAWPGNGLVRHDAATGESQVRSFGPGRTVGEAVFVPRADDAAEDDGWYLALVHDAATDRSDLVVIDGQDWLGEPTATVHLPVRVPLGFHGNWVATGT
ncbi:MAG: carotenoid oxygenase family protein [Acidimicrobiales bacterium]